MLSIVTLLYPCHGNNLYQISYHNNITLKFYEYGIGLNSFGAIKILKLFYERAITISVNINRFSFDPSGVVDLLYIPFYSAQGDNYDIFIIARRQSKTLSRCIRRYFDTLLDLIISFIVIAFIYFNNR